eukprot:COSAG01_NODE_11912_length_1836_cov_9.228941_2_plen_209_part_00
MSRTRRKKRGGSESWRGGDGSPQRYQHRRRTPRRPSLARQHSAPLPPLAPPRRSCQPRRLLPEARVPGTRGTPSSRDPAAARRTWWTALGRPGAGPSRGGAARSDDDHARTRRERKRGSRERERPKTEKDKQRARAPYQTRSWLPGRWLFRPIARRQAARRSSTEHTAASTAVPTPVPVPAPCIAAAARTRERQLHTFATASDGWCLA